MSALQDILENLKYPMGSNLDSNSELNQGRIRFDYIVRSNKFSQRNNVWEGEVVDVAHRNAVRTFSNRHELEGLLSTVE